MTSSAAAPAVTRADVRAAVRPVEAWWTALVIDRLVVPSLPWLARRRSITPNLVTAVGIVLGGLSVVAFARASFVAAALLYEARFILDCVDGKLARVRNQTSRLGALLDHVGDAVVIPAAYACIAVSLARAGHLGRAFALALPAGALAIAGLESLLARLRRGATPPAEAALPRLAGAPVIRWFRRRRLTLRPWTVEAETIGLFLAPLLLPATKVAGVEVLVAVAYVGFIAVDAVVIARVLRRRRDATEDAARGGFCVVGSGWMFTSGISYYTCRLANALAETGPVGVILMRRLIPARFYPGRDRVGRRVNNIDYAAGVDVFDGVDWCSPLSLWRSVRFLRRQRPVVVVFQWWTGAVLHSYLVLVMAARATGAKVVVEFHETQDSGERRIGPAARYHDVMSRAVLRRCDAGVVHSEFDRERVARVLSHDLALTVVPHGPFDHHRAPAARPRSTDVTNLLFFGTIRPYKGLEYLVQAFDSLDPEAAARFHLTVAGETWEGWTRPLALIERSRYRESITVINRYVDDDEVSSLFAAADAVVLPYLRSSASGPLHIAMSAGLPVVVTDVGGLRAAAGDYSGAVWVPPGDVAALSQALLELQKSAGTTHRDPRSWQDNVAAYAGLAATASR